VKSPPFVEPAPEFINVATNIGDPYFQPDLSADVVAFYVAQAQDYAVRAHGTTTFPADAAIDAYVRTQLTAVVTDGRLAAVGDESGSLPIYSQAQLIIDTGQFIAGESTTASTTSADRGWLARIVAELAGAAEAYLVPPDPCAGYTEINAKIFCEAEIPRGWDRYNLAYWHDHYEDFIRFFFDQVFNEAHTTKAREDSVAWALETGPSILEAEALQPSALAKEIIAMLGALKCPLLVVHGTDDVVIDHAVGVEAARHGGGRLLSIVGGGHLPMVKDPVRFNLALRRFGDRVTR
jgi:pimeloyl-ACP methyl ester carboxylesterase